jgi:hypothetical protein
MRKTRIVIAVALLLVAAIAAGAQSQQPPTLSRTANRPTIDGVVSPGEYPTVIDLGGASLALSLGADTLYIGMTAQASGWLGIGISPQGTMDGATIFIGALEGGRARVTVERGAGFTHGPESSTVLESSAVTATSKSATMELAVKEAPFIARGQRQLGFIVAVGPSMDITGYHGGARTPLAVNLAP